MGESESKQTSLKQEKEDNKDKRSKSPSINPTTQFNHKISKIKHHNSHHSFPNGASLLLSKGYSTTLRFIHFLTMLSRSPLLSTLWVDWCVVCLRLGFFAVVGPSSCPHSFLYHHTKPCAPSAICCLIESTAAAF